MRRWAGPGQAAAPCGEASGPLLCKLCAISVAVLIAHCCARASCQLRSGFVTFACVRFQLFIEVEQMLWSVGNACFLMSSGKKSYWGKNTPISAFTVAVICCQRN